MSASEPRACPACGGADRQVLFHQDFAVVEQSTPITGYDVVVCVRCGCGYADGIPDQATLDRYYHDMSKYEYHQRAGAESEFDQRRLAIIADIIAPRLPTRDARVLDVGCATGRLLSNLRDRGFRGVVGIDPSPACAAAARRLYGIDVREKTLAELGANAEKFDLAIVVGVLEHLRDLDGAFANLRTILDSGGLLYLEVPDATAFADWDNAPYQEFSTEHINFFGPVSLENLMGKHGFARVFLERNHREQSHRTVMSNISAMFRKGKLPESFSPATDRDTIRGLKRYIDKCSAADANLRTRIDALANDQRPILVWGVGTHTTRLMATSRLSGANIMAFIESNVRYHGKSLHGKPILAPGALKGRKEPVLISSRVFQHEIERQIRDDLGCDNELILLYDV